MELKHQMHKSPCVGYIQNFAGDPVQNTLKIFKADGYGNRTMQAFSFYAAHASNGSSISLYWAVPFPRVLEMTPPSHNTSGHQLSVHRHSRDVAVVVPMLCSTKPVERGAHLLAVQSKHGRRARNLSKSAHLQEPVRGVQVVLPHVRPALPHLLPDVSALRIVPVNMNPGAMTPSTLQVSHVLEDCL